MKKSIAGAVVAMALMMNVSAFAEGNVVGNAVMFPLRLTTAAVGGVFGIPSGGVEGVIDMEKHVFEKQGRNEEEGYVKANSLTLPGDIVVGTVVAPVGFARGAIKGFAEGVHSGWNLWGDDLPGSTK